MKKLSPIQANNQGFALIYAILVMLVLLTLGMTLLHLSTVEAAIANNQVRRTQAMYAAEAGLETALVELKEASNAQNPTGYSRNMNFKTVEPGNLQTSYEISLTNVSGDIYEITAIGHAGKAKYTQKAKVEINLISGEYLAYALTAYGTGGSRIGSYSVVNGDIQTGGTVDGIVNGEVITGSPVFPELPEKWYIPAGYPAEPFVIKGHIKNNNTFSKLAEAINNGERYLRIDGHFRYCPTDFDFQGAVIECTGHVQISDFVDLSNVTFVSSGKMNLGSYCKLTNVVFVSNGNNNDITLGTGILGSNMVIYGKGDVVLGSFGVVEDTLIIASGTVTVGGFSQITGSIISESFYVGDFVTIDHDPDLDITYLPEGLGGISVKLQSWGVPPGK